jgi:hypothetical protein
VRTLDTRRASIRNYCAFDDERDARHNAGASLAIGKALRREDLAFLKGPTARVHITHGDSDWI